MRLFRRPDGRYYAIAQPQQDLLGDWVVMTFHGSDTSRLGSLHTYLTSMIRVEELVKTRVRHGYSEVPCKTDKGCSLPPPSFVLAQSKMRP